MLHVNGALAPTAESPTDALDVVVDGHGELTVVLLDVRSAGTPRPTLSREALGVTSAAIKQRAPMYELVSVLRTFAAAEPRTRVGALVLRFSQPDARIEILNAGMPAIACVIPGGHVTTHAALSAAIGERFGEVHPYELSPLTWGATWILASDGLTQGRSDPDAVHEWVASTALGQRAAELCGSSQSEIENLLAKLTGPRTPAPFGDAGLLLVNANPTRRFRSGIL